MAHVLPRTLLFCVGFSLAPLAALSTANAQSVGPHKGDLILPKRAWLRLETAPGKSSPAKWADQIPIGWPVPVQKVDGQWVKIRDDEGYAWPGTAPCEGWIRKEEVVTLDKALDEYTRQIISYSATDQPGRPARNPNARQTKTILARLYWLRGVLWEQGDPKSLDSQPSEALADFRAATSKDGSLVDAFIRQGRIVAKYEPVDAHVLWKSCFYSAYRLLSGEAKRGTPSDGRESATAGDEKAPPPAPEPVEPVPALDSLDPPKLESLPPQLAYEVGRAYYYMQKAKADRYSDEEARVTIAQENRPYDERNPPTPGKPLTGVAGRAEAFVKFAGKKCPTWYRPPAALGDIYAAKALLRPGNDRPDLKTVQIRYLSRAASQFRNSLRFNARYDDALRGQAEALQYLAVDPNPPEITGVTDDQIEYFLSAGYGANPAAQSRMLDEAYRSAEAANIVTGGRDAKTLRIIGRIENFRTFMVNAGKSYEYAARAAQIFREAGEISLSTSDRNELDDSVLYSKRTAYWVLANLAAQVESEFREASAEAETIRPTVDTLFAKMGSIRPFPDQDLGEAIRSAHHAFVGIENIQPLGKELTVPATKRLTAPRVGSVAAQAAARPTVYDINAWPNELPTVRDLMDRVAEIGSWRLIFRQLEIRAAVFARQYVIPPELPKDDPKRILLIEFIADLGELPKP